MSVMSLHVTNNTRTGAATGPSQALGAALRDVVKGEVRFDRMTRSMYSTDGSNYRQTPIGVVIPRDADDVIHAVEVCRAHDAPILGRGGGTSLAGQCCNTGVVFDFSKYMNRVIDIDPQRRTARVQPGCVLDNLRNTAISQHGLSFGPDPATHTHCTLGGMIGNNSCGVHSVLAGRTVDNVVALEVLTYDGQRLTLGALEDEHAWDDACAQPGRPGEIYRRLREIRDQHAERIRARYPNIPRRVSGYNLDQLLPENGGNIARAVVGSESTCVLVLEATVRLIEWPKARVLAVLGYPNVFSAADQVPQILQHKPIGLEGIDQSLVQYIHQKHMDVQDRGLLPDGDGWLLCEFGADSRDEAAEQARAMIQDVRGDVDRGDVKLFTDEQEEADLWEIRESALGATANVPGMKNTWPGWEDSAVPPAQVGSYLRAFRKLLDEYGYDCALYGHFGDGCIHCRINFDLQSRQGIDHFLSFIHRAADLVVEHGGSLSGEHGDGQARGALLGKMFGPELLDAFRMFKRAWDPAGRMNPGKVIDAYKPDDNLRLGTSYNPPVQETYFQYPNDNGSFAHATLRCVGVGKCRRSHDAFMCPSFIATHDERDSTRGRARALFEMLRGETLADGWRDDGVHEALHLCLGCKGCRKECPVDVDMATYKAEFLAHYWHARVRPRTHYAMGMIGVWARAAAALPRLANFFGQAPGLASLSKRIAGVAQERKLPAFATETFEHWFKRRDGRGPANGKLVILLPDAFNNYFFPETLQAAVEVLERCGYRVKLPPIHLPAVRPRLHYGMLSMARTQIRKVVAALRQDLRAGVPVVGCEPSAVAVYRDEAVNLFPHHQDVARMARATRLLSEFLIDEDARLPTRSGRVLLHVHCHQKAVLDGDAARLVLRRIGYEIDEPQPGCCGMAGSFGYEAGEKYHVSMSIAEEHLLPAVRAAADDTPLVADGFSCREQILQGAGRRAHHLAVHLRDLFAEDDR